jgi:hypothetical protein
MERERKRDQNHCDLFMQIFMVALWLSYDLWKTGFIKLNGKKIFGTLQLLQNPRTLRSAKPLSLVLKHDVVSTHWAWGSDGFLRNLSEMMRTINCNRVTSKSSQVKLIFSPKQRAKPKTSARKKGSSMPHCVTFGNTDGNGSSARSAKRRNLAALLRKIISEAQIIY